MNDLAPYLQSIGLSVTRVRGDEIGAHCPAHQIRIGRPDTSASFDFNQDKLVGHCYSCDYNPTFPELVEFLTGSPPDYDVTIDVKASSIASKMAPPTTEEKKQVLGVNEWFLVHRFTAVPLRILAFKRLLVDAADAFMIRWDPERHCYVIPVYDLDGQLAWWQLRQKGGVRNEPDGIAKSEYLYGMHRVMDEEAVAVVESPLDVPYLWQAGIPAVSTFGAAVSNAQIALLARHFTRVVVALDNDPPGRNGAEWMTSKLRARRVAVHPWRYDTPGWPRHAKDPGDCDSPEMLRTVWERTLRFGL